MRTFYEEWRVFDSNLAVTTAKSQDGANLAVATAKLNTDEQLMVFPIANVPVAAFFSIGFTHHTTILSKVKTQEGDAQQLHQGHCRLQAGLPRHPDVDYVFLRRDSAIHASMMALAAPSVQGRVPARLYQRGAAGRARRRLGRGVSGR